MAFEFILSTDEIREKMFDFIKPVYKSTYDFDVDYINWIYGVYDIESRIFITYVNTNRDNDKYILITDNGGIFFIITDRYQNTFSEIPEELKKYSDIIKNGIMLYNNDTANKNFNQIFLPEQKKGSEEITENMKDRCRPSIDIKSYEDAEKLFIEQNLNYNYISCMYNKKTVAQFNKYMSDERMLAIRGEKYIDIIKKISAYNDLLSKDDYQKISSDFLQAGLIVSYGMNDIYEEMTLNVVKKAYFSGVISVGYTGFIKNYIISCIKSYPYKIQDLRPLVDFINEHMRAKEYIELDFYRKELEKLIYNRVEGFNFVLTTDELREKMYDFLKPEYKSVNDLDVTSINWTTGVYDKESRIFLTMIYYVSEGISRCGINYYTYLVITDIGDIFKVINNDEREKGTYDFRISQQYSALTEKIKEGIAFYDNNYEYEKNLSKEKTEELKIINDEMDDRCHQNFPINSEKDAQKLFNLRKCNVNFIRKIYNRKTVSDFNKYVTDDKINLWRDKK